MISKSELKHEASDWAKDIGISFNEIHIRPMKRKLASCSSRGRLTFASSLLEEPKEVRSEVIVHELMHIRIPNHGKMFKALMRSYLNRNEDCVRTTQ
jgi:predicted metal-dependent hydrolase